MEMENSLPLHAKLTVGVPSIELFFPRDYQDDNKFPAIDVFICTVDPQKEPTVEVMNTVLSVMALDYYWRAQKDSRLNQSSSRCLPPIIPPLLMLPKPTFPPSTHLPPSTPPNSHVLITLRGKPPCYLTSKARESTATSMAPFKQPAKTITASDGSTTPNPSYDLWETQDNLILSCINSSLSDEVLAQSRAKAVHVRTQLSTLRKGNQSATDYFMTIKRLTDELAIAGQALTCAEIIPYLLAGLGPEYDSLVSMVSHRDNSLTLEELYSMLLTCEARIEHNNQMISLPMASANVATRQQHFTGGRGRGTFSPPRRGVIHPMALVEVARQHQYVVSSSIHKSQWPPPLDNINLQNQVPSDIRATLFPSGVAHVQQGISLTLRRSNFYNYPPEKLHVYLSDDGGASITLTGMKAAFKFARSWLPFCKKYGIKTICPKAYFSSSEYQYADSGRAEFMEEKQKIKEKYEAFKERVLRAAEKGQAEGKNAQISTGAHPSLIEVINEKGNEATEQVKMPLLVYVSREKRPSHPHHFKAGALNVLLRVSGVISNSPYMLVLDCDMYCNDPTSARQAMCFHFDPKISPSLAFVQFPQTFHNLSKNDIYDSEIRSIFRILWYGLDGLKGPVLSGTNFYIKREALYGISLQKGLDLIDLKNSFGQSNEFLKSLRADHKSSIDDGSDSSSKLLPETKVLASCAYEENSKWGEEASINYHILKT
ncbi:hypothetical protein Pint_24642 [Pistacia integerrima]|uniref:Uncharacterized protein n=1 Tax=Pistacia integerrima TaxID=434235 RepID=A0ACC0YCQ0_9ROSI|nr:hypothetical protein Pint_24642 [Pistacia integerrima]